MTIYETIIGLEVHAQLQTQSKMFCGCSADYASAPPNTHVCPVCMALPGVLPVINRAAVEKTILAGLALNCTINPAAVFRAQELPLRRPAQGLSNQPVRVAVLPRWVDRGRG